MDLKQLRDRLKLTGAVLCFWLYLPHLIIFLISGTQKKELINGDLERLKGQLKLRITGLLLLLYFLHTNRYYRSAFYYRIGIVPAMLISWYRPGDRYFNISKTTKIGKGFWYAHPYSTIINADTIGENFSCLHLTTVGDSKGVRPRIGNNVSLGANVTIIGDVTIGDNVTIAAGSVVVKSIPADCIAAGVPAKVVKWLKGEEVAQN